MKLHKNIYIWYIVTFFLGAAFTLPVWVIFNTEVLGLTNTQAFLLGVLPYGLSAALEVPTGSWADKYGRVKVFQLGTFLYILSAASYIFFTDFYMLAFFQALGGLGLAMGSGGLEALVHDSIDDEDKDAIYALVHGKKMALVFVSRVLTVLLSGFLYANNPRLPFVITVVAYIMGLIVSFFFKDVRLEAPTSASSYEHIKETFKLMLEKRVLWLFLGLLAVYTFFSEVMFALYQPYFKSIDVEIGEFGVYYAVISAFSALGAVSVVRLAKRHNALHILFLMMLAVLVTLGAMLFKMPALTYLAVVPSSLAFGYAVTLQNTITQKFVSSRHQATAISIASLLRTGTFMLSVVGVGVALDYLSVADANALFAGLTALFLLPFIISLRRKATI